MYTNAPTNILIYSAYTLQYMYVTFKKNNVQKTEGWTLNEVNDLRRYVSLC